MNGQYLLLLLSSVVTLFVIRGFMSLALWECLSKKKRKNYHKELSFVNRWFFISAPGVVRNIYDKTERRVINYTGLFKVYRTINYIIHISLLIETVFVSVYYAGLISEKIVGKMCLIYFAICLISFVILATIELFIHRRYHRSRYKS